MPFAGYKDFQDCVTKVMSNKNLNKERASAYCAAIARKAGENLQFEPPAYGNLPPPAQDILKKTYVSCRTQWVKEHPDDRENHDNKTRCSSIAWGAVKKQYKKVGDKWERLDNDDYDMKVKFFSDESNNCSLLVDKELLVDCHPNVREKLSVPIKSLLLTHYNEKMLMGFKDIKNHTKTSLKVYGFKNTLKMYQEKLKNLRYIKFFALKPNKTYKINNRMITPIPVKFSLFKAYNPAMALKVDNTIYNPVIEPVWFKGNAKFKKELEGTSLNILSNQLNTKECLEELEKYNVKNIYFTNPIKQELKSCKSCYDGLLLGIKRLKEGEIHKNMDLDEVDNKYLLYIHSKLHSVYPCECDKGYTPEILWGFHSRVTDEMKNRGLKHVGKDKLDSESFEEPVQKLEEQPIMEDVYSNPITKQLLHDLEISLTGESKQTITLDSAIGVDLSQEVKLPYKFKFIALKEGKYNGVFYDKKKLEYAAPTLIGKDITLDHGTSVRDIVGVVEDSWWNTELEQIEGIGIIKTDMDIAEKIHLKLITGVSVEIFVKYMKTSHGLSADQPRFTAISLVKNPACKTCGVTEVNLSDTS